MISESLMTNTTLTTLDLWSDDKIEESEEDRKKQKKCKIEQKKKGNEKNTQKLTGNNIGAEGAKKISESLMTNTTLTKLDLSSDDKIE